MAEQTPPVQNKGMLVVAVVLGLAVVIVYNLQIAAVRSEAVGDQVKILRFERDMRQGEKIDVAKDFSIQEISRKLAEGLSDVAIVRSTDEMKMFQSNVLNRNVVKGNFFSTSMITTKDIVNPANNIHDPRNVLRAVPLRDVPGDSLRPGDRVNLVARIPGKGGMVRPERILEDVYVLAIGGKGASDSSAQAGGGGGEGQATYRSITIEVSKQTSLDLEQVLSYVGGGVIVEVLRPDAEKSAQAGVVKPGILQIIEGGAGAPAPKAGSGGGGGGGGPL